MDDINGISSLKNRLSSESPNRCDKFGFALNHASKVNLPRRVNLTLKRLIDVVVSLSALFLLFPLFVVVAMTIKLTSSGPAMIRQKRWGRGQTQFKVFKFRTMYVHLSDMSGVSQTVFQDPRITPIGRFLRRTNIDELPQLLNILIGDMSLVGPRCHPVGMLAAGVPYERLVENYHDRHVMRPGLTGLAQANGFRGPTADAFKAMERIRYDLIYVRQFDLLMDARIILKTIMNEIRGGSGF